MFETLADHNRHDEGPPASKGERFLRWAVVGAVSLALFGGLYLVMQNLEH
ncbi:MAG: hypothetical protein ABSH40_11710 [Bryobacteraceae bacterium]|jgi:hypothetical protein